MLQDKVLKLALPAIASNITVPLLGLVDTAIVGHLGNAQYIAAIAVGNTMFSMIYWFFSFLRMGTSGFTSQAWGARNWSESGVLLLRSLLIALFFGLFFCVVQKPLLHIIFRLMHTSLQVQEFATTYFRILIWGAPAVLALYSFMGWFVGMQNSRFPMYISILQNVVNVVLSFALVYGLHLNIEGIAWGTLVAQYAGVGMSLWLWWKYYGRIWKHIYFSSLWNKEALKRFFNVNKDIFLRTVCLIFVTVYFTSSGTSQGDYVLSANMLMMQFFVFFSYFMDGFAYAGEALAGKHLGAKNQKGLLDTVRKLFKCALVLVILFSLVYIAFGSKIISLLTNEPDVLREANRYLWWIYLIPLTGFSAFVWDGVFIGITRSQRMFASMLVATIVFFCLRLIFMPWYGNHGLWLAFVSYLLFRGLSQSVIWWRWHKSVVPSV